MGNVTTSGDTLIAMIAETIEWIVDIDLPDLEDEDHATLIGHLTGALVARLYETGPLETMTAQQTAILNSLVTFAAEHVPGGLSDDEREVAQLVGRATLAGGEGEH